MSYPRYMKSLFLVLSIVSLLGGCRAASYEIIKGKKSRSDDKGNPTKIVDPTVPTDATPSGINMLPTARVEVILNDRSMTKVRVNVPVMISPSLDTVDPDDIEKSKCVNPGIVKAAYEIDTQASKIAQRPTAACDSLAIPYTFTKAGVYEIAMTVTSNENETAFASMTLIVIDNSTPDASSDGGFKIKADPMLAGQGQEITFTGDCDATTATTISWDFGDGSKGDGEVTKHAYVKNGQYRVEGTCTDQKGQTRKAVITIVVVEKPVVIPGADNQPGDQLPEPIPTQPQPDDNCGCTCDCCYVCGDDGYTGWWR